MRLFLSLLALAGLLAAAPLAAQPLCDRAAVLQAMHQANDWFVRRHPDAAAPTFVKKERPSNLWTRGVYFEGLSELNRIDPQPRNTAYMNEWARGHRYMPRNGTQTRDADDYCCSQAYLDMYVDSLHLFREMAMLWPTEQCMNNLVATRRTPPTAEQAGARFAHSSAYDWTWVDAIQMGLPVLAKLARVFLLLDRAGSDTYAQQGWLMYQWARDSLAGGLYNERDGLWWRDADFVPPYREPNGEDCYWSRGNGWAYAALVRTMDAALLADSAASVDWREPDGCTRWTVLPHETHFGDYEADFLRMSKALLKCQREDLFWNVSLHDGTHFGGPELTGTALFVYGMAWGVRHGLLSPRKYLPVVTRTWQAMVDTCLHPDGQLGYVQGTGKEPKDSQPVGYDTLPDFDDFGLGCFLLAGSEVYRLCVQRATDTKPRIEYTKAKVR